MCPLLDLSAWWFWPSEEKVWSPNCHLSVWLTVTTNYHEFTSSNSILQGALIEDVGGEGAEGRVHAVLDLKTDGPDAQNHKALKERLGQACLCCLLTHHHRAQLAVIPHQNQLQKKNTMKIKKAQKSKFSCGSQNNRKKAAVILLLSFLLVSSLLPVWSQGQPTPCTLVLWLECFHQSRLIGTAF